MESVNPIYLLAGGPGAARRGPDPLLERVFAVARQAAPSIAYVGAASDDDAGFFKWIAARFRSAGSGPVRLAPLASPRADLDEARSILQAADLVYMTGGDVEAGMHILQERKMDGFLHQLHASGKPFFGLSAGSIMLARAWVRWADPDNDATAEAFPCLGFAPILCDTHAEADDWEELKVLLGLSVSGTVGFGIPSGGALCVAQDGTVAAIGKPAPRFEVRNGRIRTLAPLPPDNPHGQ
jgi:cyanophycinase-like exopeptidase